MLAVTFGGGFFVNGQIEYLDEKRGRFCFFIFEKIEPSLFFIERRGFCRYNSVMVYMFCLDQEGSTENGRS